MSKKLNDTQLVILSTVAQRDDRSVMPLPDDLSLTDGARIKCLQALLTKGLIEEVDGIPDWRGSETEAPKVLRISAAGLTALDGGEETPAAVTPTKQTQQPRGGKTDAILKLMRRKQGATIPALQEATGWLPHSVRAALTGLRKKGIEISRDKNGKGETIYRAGA